MPLQISIYNRQKQTSANGKEYIGRALAFAPGQRGAISDTCEQPPFYIRDQRGDKQWIRLEARTLADAKVEAEKQQRILQALARGVEIAQANDDDKQRLTNQVAVFLAETEANKSLATWAAYNRSLELFLESCKRLNVSDVKREDLLQFKTYLKKKEFSGRTVYNNFLNVCIFLAWAKHPAEGLGIKKGDWPPKVVGRVDWVLIVNSLVAWAMFIRLRSVGFPAGLDFQLCFEFAFEIILPITGIALEIFNWKFAKWVNVGCFVAAGCFWLVAAVWDHSDPFFGGLLITAVGRWAK
jgi:hypothetical protein